MKKCSTAEPAASAFDGEAWFDPIEQGLRGRIKQFIEELVEQEATAALGRGRYQRGTRTGYRNGTRQRGLLGTFGPVELTLPRICLARSDGRSQEWRSAVIPRYARMTRQVEGIASVVR